MNIFQYIGQSIFRKLVVLLLLVATVPALAVGLAIYSSSSSEIETKATDQLEAIKTVKANQLTDYFKQIENQVRTFSENTMVVDAMKQFPAAETAAAEEAGTTPEDLERMRNKVEAYYKIDFTDEYSEITGTNPPVAKQLAPLDDDSIYLQYQYIANNPNPLGEKEVLDAAKDNTTYSQLHKKYHPVVRSYLQKFGYYDIFLCDLNSGDIVYSVFKELDFTTSLSKGPYSSTNFGRAFELAANATSKDDVFLVDYEDYMCLLTMLRRPSFLHRSSMATQKSAWRSSRCRLTKSRRLWTSVPVWVELVKRTRSEKTFSCVTTLVLLQKKARM